MLTISKIVVVIAVLFLVSFLLGTLVFDAGQENLFTLLGTGYFLLMSVFLLASLPCIFLGASLGGLSMVVAVAVAALCAVALYRLRGRLSKTALRKLLGANFREQNLYLWIALALVTFQVIALGFGMHTDDDDAFYVATAVTAVDTDRLYVYNPYTGDPYSAYPARYILSPFPLFGAVISWIFRLRPVIFFHTALPFFIIPLAYMVGFLLGLEVFHETRRAWLFVGCLALVNLFSYFSTWSQGVRLLLRPWQGKTVLACVIIPFLFVLYMRRTAYRAFTKQEYLALLAALLAGCFVSSMGIFLTAAAAGLLAFLMLLFGRRGRAFLTECVLLLPNLALALVYLAIR